MRGRTSPVFYIIMLVGAGLYLYNHMGGRSQNSAPEEPKPKWMYVEGWRQLQTGMSPDQIRSILGEPGWVKTEQWPMSIRLKWDYQEQDHYCGYVEFRNNVVTNWTEPSWENLPDRWPRRPR